MTSPKLFVSYSWTSQDHETWVINLATELRESGVDVILDKWDLKEGHDAHAFMERMVTDSDVKKVVLVCNKSYAEKANDRSGGVGTETQIISAEIYAKQAQGKFVALVTERDDKGDPYLPAYYRSRIYIDMTDRVAGAEGVEQLLRWVFDQPRYEKPEIGNKPTFLQEEKEGARLSTSVSQRRAVEAIKNTRPSAIPTAVEYLETLAVELEKFRLQSSSDEAFDDLVVKSIENFIPYRNEAIAIFSLLARYRNDEDCWVAMHRFFERLIPYLSRPPEVTQWREWDFDNFKFIVHELFIYAISILIKEDRFDGAAYLLSNEYYGSGRAEYGRETMIGYGIFSQHLTSLDARSKRLNLRRLSLQSDLLQQRCQGIGIELRHLMQADLILFLRGQLAKPDESWWPFTLLFARHASGPLEVFARARSRAYFDRMKVVLGIKTKEELGALWDEFGRRERYLPRWDYQGFDPSALTGFEELATRP